MTWIVYAMFDEQVRWVVASVHGCAAGLKEALETSADTASVKAPGTSPSTIWLPLVGSAASAIGTKNIVIRPTTISNISAFFIMFHLRHVLLELGVFSINLVCARVLDTFRQAESTERARVAE